jgi:hypothetical protein
MSYWTLDDISWDHFDRGEVDPETVRLVKAASLVEYNGAAYAHHLCRIFDDDPSFQRDARRWGEEETRHGEALARWAGLADPEFDFAAAFARFRAGFCADFDCSASRRGSRAGEMVARCMVEVGTSSYYTALRDSAREPVLKQICRYIAADEIRHYKLFYKHLTRCLEHEPLGVWARLRVAAGRVAESADDELAYAYYAANEDGRAYDRRRCSRAYARRALALYRRHHVTHGVAMICKAVGLNPHGLLARATGQLAWNAMRWRAMTLGIAGP